MPRRPDMPCAECGEMMWRSRTSLPQGQARCRQCRAGAVKHGEQRAYKRGCRCDECRAGQRDRMREYVAMVTARDGLSPSRKYRPRQTPETRCDGCGAPLNKGTRCSSCRRRFRISHRRRLAIYERDNWTCQLCLEPVDRNLHYLDDWAATLDHIECQSWVLVPDHSSSNLRLAHRWCNAVRGDGSHHTEEVLRYAGAA